MLETGACGDWHRCRGSDGWVCLPCFAVFAYPCCRPPHHPRRLPLLHAHSLARTLSQERVRRRVRPAAGGMKGKVAEEQHEDEEDDLTARQSAPSCPPHAV
jgi:hypothetical protein